MNMLYDSNALRFSPDAAQYVADSAKHFMRHAFHPLAATEHTAEVDFILSLNQQRTLKHLVYTGEFGARQILIIEQLAKCFAQRGVSLLDLIRSIDQGLKEALDTFEAVGSYCFSSSLLHCIYHYIERTLLSRNTISGSFQTRRAPSLSFDNPAHQRRRI